MEWLKGLPHRHFTEHDLALTPEDGRRYELVEGALIVSPLSTVAHQVVVACLAGLLYAAAPPGVVPLHRVGVRAARSVLVPDVVVVPTSVAVADAAVVAPEHVVLVVEVVSSDSVTMDRVTKPSLYAAVGIPAYWRVERDHPGGVLLAVHELDGDSYRLVEEVVGDAEAVVERPFPLRFRPAELLAPRTV